MLTVPSRRITISTTSVAQYASVTRSQDAANNATAAAAA